jgi:hypothetical protein
VVERTNLCPLVFQRSSSQKVRRVLNFALNVGFNGFFLPFLNPFGGTLSFGSKELLSLKFKSHFRD